MNTYKRYALKRVFTISDIVTADYIDNEIIPGPLDEHFHEEAWELLFCKTGILNVYLEGDWLLLRANDCVFIRPGRMHDVRIDKKDTAAFVVSFICSNSDYLLPLEHKTIHARQRDVTLIDLMAEELAETFQIDTVNMHLSSFHALENAPFGSEQIICSYLEQIIIFMLRDVLGKEELEADSSGFKTVMESYLIKKIDTYVKENYNNRDISVSSVAAFFHYSRTRISTLYKNATGHSLHDVINETRLKKAKQLLEETDLSVSEIASEAGFHSLQYFSNSFKSVTGITPSLYREKMSVK